MYKLTENVLVLSTGFARQAGQPIGIGEVDGKIWRQWVLSGIVADSPPAPLKVEPAIEEPPLPKTGGSPEKQDGDLQLRDLSDPELRQMGRKYKVKQWHLLKTENLIKALEELSQ